ncbi:MAG: transcriptional regulator [Planctomycetota bacterium]|nr:MAG: transcriptional regulator [Planctomycetota bacterium]
MAPRQDERIRLLEGVRLFQGLNAAELSEVVGAAKRLERKRNATLFRQGQEATRFFVVLDGRVRISQIAPDGHQIIARYAGSGELFGCVPLFGGDAYPGTATAVTHCTSLSWDRSTTARLMERYPRVAVNALHLLGEELAQLRGRYQELATQRVEQRVARALVRLVGQAGKRVEEGVLIDFPLSRQDLAELTGTTLHTVSRILSAWEDHELIASGRRRVVIRRPHDLVTIAEDLGPGGHTKT